MNGIFDETVISNGTRPRLSSSINHIVPFHLRVLLLTVFLRNLLHWVCHWISIQNPWNNRVCFEWKFKFEFVCALKSGNMRFLTQRKMSYFLMKRIVSTCPYFIVIIYSNLRSVIKIGWNICCCFFLIFSHSFSILMRWFNSTM